MALDQLEARLQLAPGELQALEMRRGSRYTHVLLFPVRTSWTASASRKTRSAWEPCNELKAVQSQIRQLISARFEVHPIAHAYVRGRGIVTNARKHVGKQWVFHVDLVNFFGAITEEMVFEALKKLLTDFSHEEIGALSRLCCREGSLPQGAPSSPVISNLVCCALDEQLDDLAKSLGIDVTRYSDDIYFSSTSAVFPPELGWVWGQGAARQIALAPSLSCVFEGHGFRVNLKKLRFQNRAERQLVAGLVVNDGVNVPRKCYRKVSGALRLWERYGLHEAARHCQPRSSDEEFANSLRGFIAYVGHVTGRGNAHRGLLEHYDRLKARDALA